MLESDLNCNPQFTATSIAMCYCKIGLVAKYSFKTDTLIQIISYLWLLPLPAINGMLNSIHVVYRRVHSLFYCKQLTN